MRPLCLLFIFSISAQAQTLGSTARQLSKGAFETTVMYQGTSKQHLNFEVTDGGSCAPNATIPVANFNCGSTADVAGRGNGQAMIAKFNYQPAERGLIFYATAGVGDYAVKVGTVTVFNSSLEDKAGFLTSFGAKAVVVPDTIVSPAFALDASVGMQRYYGGGERLDFMQLQVALEASHRFDLKDFGLAVEPYGGVKWLRNQAYLKNIATQSRVGGRKQITTPFLGVKVPIFEKDSLFFEMSMVDGVQYATGLTVRFK
ncbi:MAG: hypothetical protein ABIJ96_04235 [Elusimicrobiota bacterium]